jgi:hypothetical protein
MQPFIKFDTALCETDLSIGGLKPRASFWLKCNAKNLFLVVDNFIGAVLLPARSE